MENQMMPREKFEAHFGLTGDAGEAAFAVSKAWQEQIAEGVAAKAFPTQTDDEKMRLTEMVANFHRALHAYLGSPAVVNEEWAAAPGGKQPEEGSILYGLPSDVSLAVRSVILAQRKAELAYLTSFYNPETHEGDAMLAMGILLNIDTLNSNVADVSEEKVRSFAAASAAVN